MQSVAQKIEAKYKKSQVVDVKPAPLLFAGLLAA